MLKDLSQSLVAAVAAINQKSREAYVAEQQNARKPKLPGVPQPKADPAAHTGAASMAKANIKEASEGTTPTTPKEKKLAAMSGDKTKITKGDVLKARGVSEEAVEEGVMDTLKKVGKKVVDTLGHKDDSELIKDLQKKAGVPQTGKKPVKEAWEDMLKAAREKSKPQPNGGSGKKQGSAYGGSKQKKDEDVKEEVEQVDEDSKKISKHADEQIAKHGGDHEKAADATYKIANLTRNSQWLHVADEIQRRVDSKKKSVKEEAEQVDEALRTVSKHGEGTGEHHAVVKRDAEWNEYQVHYYKNGKHMGEGPVSHHDDKEDAQSTAEHEVKRMNTKKEEVEQIAELSDDTLRSYKRGARKEMNKISAAGTPPEGSKRRAKLDKRVAGYRKAWAKSEAKNEEVEQIDELSKKTLSSYVKGAAKDAAAAARVGRSFEKDSERERKPSNKEASQRLASRFYKVAHKRQAGIEKAADRLAKEDVAFSDEEVARLAEIAAKIEAK